MTIDPRLHRIVAAQPYPLLFATISPDKRHRGKLSASLRISLPLKPGATPHPALPMIRKKNAEAKTWRETAETHKPRKGVGKLVEGRM